MIYLYIYVNEHFFVFAIWSAFHFFPLAKYSAVHLLSPVALIGQFP